MTAATPAPADPRLHWRQTLLAQRDAFSRHPDFASAQAALGTCLQSVVRQLAPQCLGLYWPIRGEFNAPAWSESFVQASVPDAGRSLEEVDADWDDDEPPSDGCPLALPFAQREPVQMHYRLWDGRAPDLRDECGIPCVAGTPVVPDVVLVPCVGFTRQGHRLGFGAGYFDRWLAAHPHVTAVGVAWSFAELPDTAWQVRSHDQALTVIVTEHGVVDSV